MVQNHSGAEPLYPNSSRTQLTLDDGIDEGLATSSILTEQEKRRRSSLASARFRQRKKKKEQEIEQSLNELVEKCKQQEKRVAELEQENKWLRMLLLEKNKT